MKAPIKQVDQDNRYYVYHKPCDTMSEALLYAGILQHNGETKSIQIYQNGKVVRIKRF